MIDVRTVENTYELELYPKRDIVLASAKNATVWDTVGNEYIDCVGGHGTANIGHCNERVIAAIQKQCEKIMICPETFATESRALLLEKLISIAPKGLRRAFLCNSGTEAIEAAIKFARYSTNKTEIICANRCFHGRTMGALSATFNPKYREGFFPLVPGFVHVTFNSIEKLANAVTSSTAAVLLELVQGEGGVFPANAEYLSLVQSLCHEKGILLLIDEVQTGFCRCGSLFASNLFALSPDILCIAKSMAGGLPMGAILCSDAIKSGIGKHGSTFGGNPLCCAAALAAIDYMLDEKLEVQAAEKGTYFLTKLRELHLPLVRQVRGLGLMIGIELREKSKPYIRALMQNGLLTLPAGSTVIRLLPPLTIDYKAIDAAVSILNHVLSTKILSDETTEE